MILSQENYDVYVHADYIFLKHPLLSVSITCSNRANDLHTPDLLPCNGYRQAQLPAQKYTMFFCLHSFTLLRLATMLGYFLGYGEFIAKHRNTETPKTNRKYWEGDIPTMAILQLLVFQKFLPDFSDVYVFYALKLKAI